MSTLESEIEPFEPSQPGPHVTRTLEELRERAPDTVEIEIGPFGTALTGPMTDVMPLVLPLHEIAFDNGADRVSVQSTRRS